MTKQAPVLAGLAALSLLCLVCPVPAHADDAEPDGPTKIELVLDSSGSMREKDRAGTAKIDAAKSALSRLAGSLPADAQVGMRVFGATEKVVDEDTPSAKACGDTQLVVPLGTGNRDAIRQAVGRYSPVGYTPTVAAVRAAVGDLGAEGNRHIILVSDGEVSCSPDPCGEIKKLTAQAGVKIQIDTVGMSLEGAGRSQLQCIAATTGGTYTDAGSTDELSTSLERISTKALRGYDFRGEPVVGATDPAAAPLVAPGQYVDHFTGDQTKYYRVAVPEGSSVFASALAKPTDGKARLGSGVYVNLYPTGRGVDWGGCAQGYSIPYLASQPDGTMIYASGAVLDPMKTGRSYIRECAGAKELVVAVNQKIEGAKDDPVELVFGTRGWPNIPFSQNMPFPEYTFEGYPPEVDHNAPVPVPEAGAVQGRVVGGGSFNTAAELKPGTSSDTVLYGETVVYKAHVDWGESATLMVDSVSPTPATLGQSVYGPHREPLHVSWTDTSATVGMGQGKLVLHTPEVRLNNVWSQWDKVHAVDEPGWVYFVVQAYSKVDRNPGPGIPLRLTLVKGGRAGEGALPDGVPTGLSTVFHDAHAPAPTTTASQAPASPSASATMATPTDAPTGESTGTSTTGATATEAAPSVDVTGAPTDRPSADRAGRLPWLIGGGALGLALVGGGAAWLARGRR